MSIKRVSHHAPKPLTMQPIFTWIITLTCVSISVRLDGTPIMLRAIVTLYARMGFGLIIQQEGVLLNAPQHLTSLAIWKFVISLVQRKTPPLFFSPKTIPDSVFSSALTAHTPTSTTDVAWTSALSSNTLTQTFHSLRLIMFVLAYALKDIMHPTRPSHVFLFVILALMEKTWPTSV